MTAHLKPDTACFTITEMDEPIKKLLLKYGEIRPTASVCSYTTNDTDYYSVIVNFLKGKYYIRPLVPKCVKVGLVADTYVELYAGSKIIGKGHICGCVKSTADEII